MNNHSINKNKTSVAIALLFGLTFTQAHAFSLGDLTKQLESVTTQLKGTGTQGSSGLGAMIGNQSSGNGHWFDQVCNRYMGKPFTKTALKESPTVLINRYFVIGDSTDFEQKLRSELDVGRKGTLVTVRLHVDDLVDKKVRRLADAFLLDPSSDMLAQVIHLAENGDGYLVEKEGSELAEAKVLLAMVMMQYPDLVKEKGQIFALLKYADNDIQGQSNLARALLARAYLFGDYAPQSLAEFDARIVMPHETPNGNSKTKQMTVEWALNNDTGWNRHQEYAEQMKMQKDIQAAFFKRNDAAKRSDLVPRVIKLLDKGDEINRLTAEALGAGPEIAQIQARLEQVQREGNGEQNIIKVRASITEEAEAMLVKAALKSPQLQGDAKAKLAQANQLRADNLIVHYGLVGETAVKFFSGEFGEVANTIGPMLNDYMKSSCTVLDRTVKLSEKLGDPPPAVDPQAVTDADFGAQQ